MSAKRENVKKTKKKVKKPSRKSDSCDNATSLFERSACFFDKVTSGIDNVEDSFYLIGFLALVILAPIALVVTAFRKRETLS